MTKQADILVKSGKYYRWIKRRVRHNGNTCYVKYLDTVFSVDKKDNYYILNLPEKEFYYE